MKNKLVHGHYSSTIIGAAFLLVKVQVQRFSRGLAQHLQETPGFVASQARTKGTLSGGSYFSVRSTSRKYEERR